MTDSGGAAPVLTANDPEPPEGTVIRDSFGRLWERVDGIYGGPGHSNWVMLDERPSDPETWTKVAGNYGPVTRAGDDR
jgi:hypothetical protein